MRGRRFWAEIKDAVVRVGPGRGFLMSQDRSAIVITAAHCLPRLPPAHPFSHIKERTWPLLAPVGEEPTVWAECVFADPVADIAVLTRPDWEALSEESEAYERFVEDRPPLRIAAARTEWTLARLLTLKGRWVRCKVRGGPRGGLAISGPANGYVMGTSGSPVLRADGRAIGVVSGGPNRNPVLVCNLPGWVLSDLGRRTVGRRRASPAGSRR